MNKNTFFSYMFPSGLYNLEKAKGPEATDNKPMENVGSTNVEPTAPLRVQIYDRLRSNPSVSYLKYGKELESIILIRGTEDVFQSHLMLVEKILGSISQRLDHALLICFETYDREIRDSILSLGEMKVILSFGHDAHLSDPQYIQTSHLDTLAISKDDKVELWKQLKGLKKIN